MDKKDFSERDICSRLMPDSFREAEKPDPPLPLHDPGIQHEPREIGLHLKRAKDSTATVEKLDLGLA